MIRKSYSEEDELMKKRRAMACSKLLRFRIKADMVNIDSKIY